ncbi:MAG: hypothetical protein Q7R94_00055 [bacterium]|nr:hypothetical protein [bacterium]
MKLKKLPAYICGPLTELPPDEQERIKSLYSGIADLFKELTGIRAFVPHEHYDPVKHADFSPDQIDSAERWQVCRKTSLLVVVAIVPSWGGGIEVEMANRSGVPVVILCEKEKLRQKKISRLLRGNPAVKEVISYDYELQIPAQLENWLMKFLRKKKRT